MGTRKPHGMAYCSEEEVLSPVIDALEELLAIDDDRHRIIMSAKFGLQPVPE